MNILKKLLPWVDWEEDAGGNRFSANEDATFDLRYKGKTIGTLRYRNKQWIFAYSEQYKAAPFVAPLANFPDIEKEYVFNELPPFFAARIPALNQPFHQKKLEKKHADKNDLVTLLEIFGRRSINNPFELVKV